MTYRISGLEPDEFAPLFSLTDDELAKRMARRVTAGADRGWPCRVSLEDARAGETLILLNYVSHYVASPYRTSYAIYVREIAKAAASYIDRTPPVFNGRVLSLRAFDKDGMLINAALAQPGKSDRIICKLFADPDIAYIHAHNAVPGCFSARVERH